MLAIVIFLIHSRVLFRSLEQNALLNVFRNIVSEYLLCGTFLKQVYSEQKLIWIFFLKKILKKILSLFLPLCDPSPLLRSASVAGLLTPLSLYLRSLYSVKANRLTLHSGGFAKVLVEGIESHLLSFHFHKHGSLLAASSNFAVLKEFVQLTPSLKHFKKFWSEFTQHLYRPL